MHGAFESGDSLRNAIYDYHLPLFAIIGYRSYLLPTTLRSIRPAPITEPIIRAWEIDYLSDRHPGKKPDILDHIAAVRPTDRCGIVLIAEGRG